MNRLKECRTKRRGILLYMRERHGRLIIYFCGSCLSICNILDSSAPATALPLFQSTVYSCGQHIVSRAAGLGKVRGQNIPQASGT